MIDPNPWGSFDGLAVAEPLRQAVARATQHAVEFDEAGCAALDEYLRGRYGGAPPADLKEVASQCGAFLGEALRRRCDLFWQTQEEWWRSRLLGRRCCIAVYPLKLALEQLGYEEPLGFIGLFRLAVFAYSLNHRVASMLGDLAPEPAGFDSAFYTRLGELFPMIDLRAAPDGGRASNEEATQSSIVLPDEVATLWSDGPIRQSLAEYQRSGDWPVLLSEGSAGLKATVDELAARRLARAAQSTAETVAAPAQAEGSGCATTMVVLIAALVVLLRLALK